MKDITLLAIDLAKNVFQLHGMDKNNKTVLRRQVKRKDLLRTICQLPPCKIAMEACSGSHYWARQFQRHGGHQIQLISPQHVKPYVKGNKTDRNDAEAIAIAALLERTPSVAVKSEEAQEIQMMHRIRERHMKGRTALANQIRGLLAEFGIVIPKGVHKLRKELPIILEEGTNALLVQSREMFYELYLEILAHDKKIAAYTRKLEVVAKTNARCQKLLKIPGIGNLTATAIIADMGDPKAYRSGRHYAANIGLVPKEKSSGERRQLMEITKRGNTALRSLFIHGGRALVRVAGRKSDKQSVWITQLVERRGINKAAVAVANKNARHAWAVLVGDEEYRPELGYA